MLRKLLNRFRKRLAEEELNLPEADTSALVSEDGTERIVVLEYFSEMRKCYAKMLEGFSYYITGVAEDALVEIENCSAVILDDRQPDICGFRIAAQIKSEKPDLPVLIVTANASLEAQEEFKVSGADLIAFKPVSELKEKLSRLLVKSSVEPVVEPPPPKKRGRRPYSFLDIAEKHLRDYGESGLSKAEFARKNKLSLSLLKNEFRIASLSEEVKNIIKGGIDSFRKSFFEHICKLDEQSILDVCSEIAERGKQGAYYDLSALKKRVSEFKTLEKSDEVSSADTDG